MRREYNYQSDREMLLPFQENVVFYAPLSEGDLTDHISGAAPSSDPGCSATWDSEKGMYLLIARDSSSSGYSPLLYNGVNNGLDTSSDLTMCIDVQEVQFNGNRYAAMITVPNDRNFNANRLYICHVRYDTSYSPISTLNRYVAVFSKSAGTFTFYKNGARVLMLTGWLGASSTNTVGVCWLHRNNTYYKMYSKNVIVYNRSFTDAEVAQLCSQY